MSDALWACTLWPVSALVTVVSSTPARLASSAFDSPDSIDRKVNRIRDKFSFISSSMRKLGVKIFAVATLSLFTTTQNCSAGYRSSVEFSKLNPCIRK